MCLITCSLRLIWRFTFLSAVDSNNINRKAFEIIAEFIQTLEWKPKAEGESAGEDVPLPDDSTQPAAPTTTDDVPF